MQYTVRRLAAVAVVSVVGLYVAGCAPAAPPGDASDDVDEPAASSSSTLDSVESPVGTGGLGDVVVVAELGYPRDLLDRNRVNLVVTRPGTERFEVITKQLRMTGYLPSPPEDRRTVIPPNGQRVALQTLLGEVHDCETTAPMSARLDITYKWGDGDTINTDSLEISDVTVLDTIWKGHCLAETIKDEFEVDFVELDVDLEHEEMLATLSLTRVSGSASLEIETLTGTVLVGVDVLVPVEARSLDSSADRVDLPLKFVVNRCDSHAVAETTRRYGLDVWVVAADGASTRVAIDIERIADQLAELVAHCQKRTRSS